MKSPHNRLFNVLIMAGCIVFVISALLPTFFRWQRREMNRTAESVVRNSKRSWMSEIEGLIRVIGTKSLLEKQREEAE